MTWRAASAAVWVVLAIGCAGVVVASIRSARIPTAPEVLRGLLARKATRGLLLLFWMWLGWHAFAR